ncbi:MAG: hypothetical protein GXP22_05190, partial [Gammaproteobacteria bacterium]|nr:hypothetical protein [Gammaproteobacteria bacterium]
MKDNIRILLIICLLLPRIVMSLAIEFSQVDYYQDGSMAVDDSAWAQVDISYVSPTSGIQWVNIVSNPGTSNEMWIVQNQPLLPSSLTGLSSNSSSFYFNAGVSNGTNITGSTLNVRYDVTSVPLTSANTGGVVDTYTVGETQNIINAGVPSGNVTLNAPVPLNLDWNIPFIGLEAGWHKNMPNVTQEKNFCGPGAAANSLQWL